MAVFLLRIQSFSWLTEWVGKNLNQRILTLGFSRRTKTCGLADSALYSTACFVCHERQPHKRVHNQNRTRERGRSPPIVDITLYGLKTRDSVHVLFDVDPYDHNMGFRW